MRKINALPGCDLWGGSSKTHVVPFEAINVWEKENGWKNQHHVQLVGLHRTGKKALQDQINLAHRITSKGGWSQIRIWGTPKDLASVSTTQKDPNGRVVYPKHPPVDYHSWADLYIEVIKKFLKKNSPDRLYFNIWVEPNRYYWRATDSTFYDFYDVVQEEVQKFEAKKGIEIKIGGVQVDDIMDNMRGEGRPWYCQTPTMDWIDRFLSLVIDNGWQLDFFDIFDYSRNVNVILPAINQVENLLLDYNIETELVFNSLSDGGHLSESSAAEYLFLLAKEVFLNTSVVRGEFDFLEDSEAPGRWGGLPNGLLEYKTLRKRPKWYIAKEILEKLDKGGIIE